MDLVLLFDLDGTLTDSREGIVKSVRYALERLSLPSLPEETLLRFIGPPLEDSFQRYCGLTEAGAEEAVRLYRERYNPIGVYENLPAPGLAEYCRQWRAEGGRLALAPSKPAPLCEKVCARFGFAESLEVIAGSQPGAGMTKADYAEMQFNNALIEEDDFDMLVMGRTQGKGCYCFVNGVLKTQIDKYVGNYRYMVVDNEAGLEHISRGTLPHVDTMLLISDCSRRGIQAVGRIAEMIREMDLKPGEMKLIVNRAPNGVLNPGVTEEINKYGLQLAGVLPQDETVYEYDCEGKPSSQVPDDTPVKKALAAVMRDLKL